MEQDTVLKIIERLAQLEAKTCTQFKSMEKALDLAKEQMDYRLAGMNQFQKRMDRLEGTFATRKEVETNAKLIYIGIGILATVQFGTIVLFTVLSYLK